MLGRFGVHIGFGAALREVDAAAKGCAMCHLRLILKAVLKDGEDVAGRGPWLVILGMVATCEKRISQNARTQRKPACKMYNT